VRKADREYVDERRLRAVEGRIAKLLKEEFGTDESGDARVEFTLVDRSRCHRLSYLPVPYAHHDDTVEAHEESFRIAMLNHNIAHGAMDTEYRVLQSMRFYRGGIVEPRRP
jgi:hypothetical protein